jgi:hypothetical protein
MKNKLNYVLVGITAIAILLAIFFAAAYIAGKHRINVLEDNATSYELEKKSLMDGFAYTQKLTQDEFKERYSGVIDSLNELRTSDKIKYNRVNSLLRLELNKERENIKVLTNDSLVYLKGDSIRIGRKGVLADSCLKVRVYAPDTSDYFMISTSLNLKADLVVYEGKRRTQHKLFGMNLFRSGKRLSTAKMFTNCDSANVEIRNIEIQKE